MDYSVVLVLVPSGVLFFAGERRADLRHLAGVLTAPPGIYSAPVQPRTSGEDRNEDQSSFLVSHPGLTVL